MMQQTETYNLNLIESSDTFSPGPLNENMEKLEAALGTKTDAADHAALEQRVVTLEGRHVVAGTYTGDGQPNGKYQFIDLGFTPIVVAASTSASRETILVWEGGSWRSNVNTVGMAITEGGFKVSNMLNLELNIAGRQYPFIAVG